MSTALDRTSSTPGRTGWTRRRRVAAVAGVLAVAALVVAAVLVVRADHRYGPVEQGSFGGEYSHAHLGHTRGGFRSWIVGPPGTEVTRMYSMANPGSHDVTVSSVDGDPYAVRVRWSPWITRAGGYVSGINLPFRDFPATIPAGSEIRLLVTIRKPHCVRGQEYAPVLTVHWDSLLGSHTTRLDYEYPLGDGFYLCRL